MKNLYYYASHIYQFSYTVPIYKKAGGTFVVKKLSRWFHFKRHFRNTNAFPGTLTLLNTPKVIKRSLKDIPSLRGIIVTASNTPINIHRNNLITIFIGHGTGDKKYGSMGPKHGALQMSNTEILNTFDYHFISGPKHREKLTDIGCNFSKEKMIKIGNVRFDDYVNGKISREKELDRLGILDRDRLNILYAPTWRWGGSTFTQYIRHFCKDITPKYNLIIRPHYRQRKHMSEIKKWCRSKKISHVYFSNPSAVIKADTINDFAASDALISDTSSIMYEYLITNKPIIVATNDYADKHKMPPEMDIMNYAAIFDGSQNIVNVIDQALSNDNRKYDELLNNCFYFNDGKSADRAVDFIESIS